MKLNEMNEAHTQDIPHEEIKSEIKPVEEDLSTGNITDILDEEVKHETIQENTDINIEDFEEVDPEELKKFRTESEKESEPVSVKEKEKEAVQTPITDDKTKQGAVVRLMKPETMLTFYNSIAGRIGKIANPKNPDCLKFDKADKEDLGILVSETVKEENWGGTPTKWLLLIAVTMIIVGKIFSWNKPPQVAQLPADIERELEGLRSEVKELKSLTHTLNQQNELLKALLEKSTSKKQPAEAGPPKKMYKGFDLSNPGLFTEKGAIIDPSKAGQKGYTEKGAKMGIPSQDEKELFKQWKLYQQYISEEEEELV